VVIDASTMYFRMSNAFTPNNDGVNDQFLPDFINEQITNYSFCVYNRWGQQVFSTTDKSKGWDGTFNNQKQPMEGYIYTLSGLNAELKKVGAKGSVLLLR
jgi:gliding motility-associated-like protein